MGFRKVKTIARSSILLGLVSIFGCYEEVDYDIECPGTVECHGADETSVFKTGGTTFYDCTWLCGSYRGDDGIYVNLTFASRDGACYQLDNEFLSEGICE